MTLAAKLEEIQQAGRAGASIIGGNGAAIIAQAQAEARGPKPAAPSA